MKYLLNNEKVAFVVTIILIKRKFVCIVPSLCYGCNWFLRRENNCSDFTTTFSAVYNINHTESQKQFTI